MAFPRAPSHRYLLASRNHSYWNDAATRLDAVKYLFIADENAELARYRGGELQVTFVVPRGQFDWIRANLADQLHIGPQLSTYFYGFNLARALGPAMGGLAVALFARATTGAASVFLLNSRITGQGIGNGSPPGACTRPRTPGVVLTRSNRFGSQSLNPTKRYWEK